MKSCSKRITVFSLLMTAAGLILVLWPTAGKGQQSEPEQSAASADPNSTVQEDSWTSFNIILKRNIFSRMRTGRGRQVDEQPRPTVVRRNPEAYFVLKGVVQQDDDFFAFVENSQTGEVLQLRRGDPVARGTIKTLTLDGLEYEMEGKDAVVVRMGYDLEGGTGVLTTNQMFDLASIPAPSGSSQPTEQSSGETADILKRLMEQRRQQMGQ